MTAGTFLGHVCPAVGCPGRNSQRPRLGWCRDVPTAREEAGCFLWVVQQSKVVGCHPGVQAFTVRGCCVVTPVDVLAIKVANIQTGVWERRDGCWNESRARRFVDVDVLANCDVYAQPLSL